MDRAKVFYNNAIDAFTLVEVSSGESKWLYDDNQGCTWESDDGTNQWIKITFKDKDGNPVSKQIEGIIILNHNLVTGDTCYLDAADNPDFSNPVTNEIDITKGYIEEKLNYPYLKLRINKVSGNIEIGEIFLFQGNYTFEKDLEWEMDITPIIEDTEVTVDGGHVYRKVKYKIETRGIQLKYIKNSQKDKMKDIAMSNYAIFFPDGVGEWLYGSFKINSSGKVYKDYYNMNLTLKENPA